LEKYQHSNFLGIREKNTLKINNKDYFIIRPMLQVTKKAILNKVAQLNLQYHNDSFNIDEHFKRNQVRIAINNGNYNCEAILKVAANNNEKNHIIANYFFKIGLDEIKYKNFEKLNSQSQEYCIYYFLKYNLPANDLVKITTKKIQEIIKLFSINGNKYYDFSDKTYIASSYGTLTVIKKSRKNEYVNVPLAKNQKVRFANFVIKNKSSQKL